MRTKGEKNKSGAKVGIKIGDLFMLQLSVVIYSLSTVAANMASKQEFLSLKYLLFFGLEFVILGVYAIIWQQAIKKFQLSVAYVNKSMTLLWSMLWNFLIFAQGITPGRVIGVVMVMAGVVIINLGEEKDA